MTAATAQVHGSHEEAQQEPMRQSEVLDGRYRVLGFIGAGSMGEVYEGEHLQIGRRVAIKFLRHSLALRERMIDQFRFEARVAGQLNSDHVASVLDFGVAQDGAVYMVMELLHGETLAQRLERSGVLKPIEAARLIAQACRGAQAAHDAGIVHCDLKPSNMILARGEDDSERLKLLDFGVSRLSAETDTPRRPRRCRNAGTPRYMSPEQAAADLAIDARTDVYALGVILYQSLTGRFPHSGRDPIAIRCHVVREDPVPLRAVAPSVPWELAEIVDRALAKSVADRYQSANQLADALQAFVARLPTIADAPLCVQNAVATLTDPPSLDATSWSDQSSSSDALTQRPLLTSTASEPEPPLRGTIRRVGTIAVVAAAGLAVASLAWVRTGGFAQKPIGATTETQTCQATSLDASETLIGSVSRSAIVSPTGAIPTPVGQAAQESRIKPTEAVVPNAARAARVARKLSPTPSAATQTQRLRVPRPLTLERENPYGQVK